MALGHQRDRLPPSSCRFFGPSSPREPITHYALPSVGDRGFVQQALASHDDQPARPGGVDSGPGGLPNTDSRFCDEVMYAREPWHQGNRRGPPKADGSGGSGGGGREFSAVARPVSRNVVAGGGNRPTGPNWSRSENERDQHLGRALVLRVGVRELLGQVALLDGRAVDEVDTG